MFDSRAEVIGWVVAVLIVVGMGVIAFTGPYHKINKVAARTQYPVITVKILTNAKTIGAYSPKTVTAHVGQEIVFRNVSNADHTATASNGAFDSGNISQQASWTYTPKHAGTYHVDCIYHPLMHATVIVK
jgi:plastocyanin